MNSVVIGVSSFGGWLIATIFGLRLLDAGRARRASLAERDRTIEFYREQATRLYAQLDDAHSDSLSIVQQREKQHAEAIDALNARHAAEIERMNAIHMVALERLANMVQFGAPTKTEGVISNPEPDAETRVINAITEDTIAAGVRDLKREYDERGIPVSEEELRDEVRSMIMGVGLSTQTIAARTLPVKD